MIGTTILSVCQLNRYVRSILEEDPKLNEVLIRGEISNCKSHFSSGHLYFSLRDDTAAVRAVMFASYARDLPFRPEDGMAVIVRAKVSVYERDGAYQLYVYDMQPGGVGALYLAFEQRKQKLERCGLFDPSHKRPLPRFPKVIGVVTSASGAAIADIRNVLTRRYPIGKLLLFPAQVQGADAPASLCAAMEEASRHDEVEVIILGRGGGSYEELSAFNDETLAQVVYDSPVPVISAVGHETDYTICDFVADLRAPTPSGAAELVCPDLSGMQSELSVLHGKMRRLVLQNISRYMESFESLRQKKCFLSPAFCVEQNRQTLDFLIELIRSNIHKQICIKTQSFRLICGRIHQVSPLATLARGYSITTNGEKVVTSVAQLRPGVRVRTQLSDGLFESLVEKMERQDEKDEL